MRPINYPPPCGYWDSTQRLRDCRDIFGRPFKPIH